MVRSFGSQYCIHEKMKRKAPGTPSVGSPAKKPKKSLQSSTVSAEATPSPEFSAQCANLRQIVDAAKNQLDGGKVTALNYIHIEHRNFYANPLEQSIFQIIVVITFLARKCES